MNATASNGTQSVYDFWLGLLPQFFSQLGAADPHTAAASSAPSPAFPFPVDQIAKAATMTQNALQALAQGYAPILQAAGAPGLIGHWAAAMPHFAALQQAWNQVGKSPADPGVMAAWMTTLPFATQAAGAAPNAATLAAATLPLQQLQRAWLDVGNRMINQHVEGSATAFDRTFGALTDALGFGLMRKLQAAGQALVAAGIEQNDARTRYAMLVHGAFAAGLESLFERLAAMARAGERVDSVLALLRLWAVCTEEAVHDVLQSEQGLETTAAIARAGLAYRRKLQHVASIVADALDMATRRDLDEAYREIQELKRQVRALRRPVVIGKSTTTRARAAKGKSA